MKFKTLKTLALVGTTALSLGFVSAVNAADNANMGATLGTSSLITVVTGVHMDFGSWLIGVPTGAPSSTLVMNPNTGAVVKTTGTGVQLLALAGTPAAGTVSVTLPTGADAVTLQMTHGVLGATLGTGLALSNVSYYNVALPAQTGVMVAATPVPITIATGATGATVRFGGTITATATPTAGVHTTTFNVAFAY